MCNDSFGTRAPAMGGRALGTGTTQVSFTEQVAGLSQGTYFVCALASNGAGTSVGHVVAVVVPAATAAAPAGGCHCLASGDSGLAFLPLFLVVLARAGRRRRR